MSSKRRLRRNMCGRKERYTTQEAAQRAMLSLKRRLGVLSYLTPYRCTFCNGFHFGHPPKHVRDGRARVQGVAA